MLRSLVVVAVLVAVVYSPKKRKCIKLEFLYGSLRIKSCGYMIMRFLFSF